MEEVEIRCVSDKDRVGAFRREDLAEFKDQIGQCRGDLRQSESGGRAKALRVTSKLGRRIVTSTFGIQRILNEFKSPPEEG
jgi:hypothetical protein